MPARGGAYRYILVNVSSNCHSALFLELEQQQQLHTNSIAQRCVADQPSGNVIVLYQPGRRQPKPDALMDIVYIKVIPPNASQPIIVHTPRRACATKLQATHTRHSLSLDAFDVIFAPESLSGGSETESLPKVDFISLHLKPFLR